MTFPCELISAWSFLCGYCSSDRNINLRCTVLTKRLKEEFRGKEREDLHISVCGF